MKVLVTGGAGYIGGVAAEALLRAGHDVVVFDSLLAGHREAVPEGAAFVRVDLEDRGAVRPAMDRARPDAVMHFAGHIQVGESMRSPFKYLEGNAVAGLRLFEAAVEAGVRRIILSSTANLFDRPARVPIDETAALTPGSPYGESKLYLERVLHWLNRTHGVASASLRYFNAAGATEERGEDHDPETHLIPLVLQAALGRRDHVTIFGTDYDTPDGTCIRDYIHVADLADAHLTALEATAPDDPRTDAALVCNLGIGAGFSVREVVDAAAAVVGRAMPTTMGPRRAGDPPVLVAAVDRARDVLGWQARRPTLEEMIGSAWEWRRAQLGASGARRSD